MILAALLATGCNNHNSCNNAGGHSHNGTAQDKDAHPGEVRELSRETDAHGHSGEIFFTKEQAETAGLETEIVTLESFRFVIRTSGRIQALQGDEHTVVASSSGVLVYANPSIAEGAHVRNGETLAFISAKNLQDGDPVIKAKLAFETAEKEFRRAEKLVSDKIISAKEFEQARMRYETAKSAYDGQAKNFTTKGIGIVSPAEGYVKSLSVSQGEYVPMGRPIAVIAKNRRLQLRADVPEKDFNHLHSIQSANFKTSYNNSVYRLADLNGRLLSYGKTSDGGAAYIPVTFEFDNIGDLVPGAFADIYLLSYMKENTLSVPESALTEEQGLYFVYLKIGEEVYKKQEVAIGQSDGIRVEILKGLGSGDEVVTKGTYQVKLSTASTAIPGHTH